MKKFIYGAILFLSVQVGFAQSQDAKNYVANMGIKEQVDAAKQQILPMIQAGKEADFTKEFDTTVTDFVTTFTKLIDENFDTDALKTANKTFAETKQLTPPAPKDPVAFQEKATALQNEVGISLQGLVMKYADPAALEGAQE